MALCAGGVEDGVGQLDGGEIEEMKQNKVQKVHSRLKSLHQSARSEKQKLTSSPLISYKTGKAH